MAQAKEGDTVRVHYSGFFEDGSIFDSSLKREPFEFTIGQGMVISGFENAVIGMQQGETETVAISPENAYGLYRNDLVVIIPKAQVAKDIDPEIGMRLQLRSPEGAITDVMVTEVTEENVTLDANHPLAGKNITFEIKLLEIVQGTIIGDKEV
jgi:FKBP-type peptidyl-prolyl cis-trans isomerase 2